MITFGPIPSRRLGKSLGINNIFAPKTCSYGCVYCQVGKTRKRTITLNTFFSPETILQKTEEHLHSLSPDSFPDFLTFVSNGEPTLDINLGKSILLLKNTGIKVAVITNASLLSHQSVRENLLHADWVSLKMDAADNRTWQKINRPHPDLDFDTHIQNIIHFAGEFPGMKVTESMIVKNINDTAENFSKLASVIRDINPSTAYLAIPTRPPAEKDSMPPDPEKMNLAWQIYSGMDIKSEFLTGFEGTDAGFTGNIYEDILNITAVHPLREDTMLKLLEKDKADYQVIESLLKQNLIRVTVYKGNKFYIRDFHLNY